jgi:hypothetical protein
MRSEATAVNQEATKHTKRTPPSRYRSFKAPTSPAHRPAFLTLLPVLRALCVLCVFVTNLRGEILERILAVVDERPVLLSEVEALATLRGIDRAAALDAAIDAHLMFAEAARLPGASLSPESEERAYASLLARWPEGAAARPEAELRRLARRETRILEYVARRFASQIRVSDEAVTAAYAADEGARPAAPPLSEVSEAIRERLAARALDERIEAWVKELRANAEIRINP